MSDVLANSDHFLSNLYPEVADQLVRCSELLDQLIMDRDRLKDELKRFHKSCGSLQRAIALSTYLVFRLRFSLRIRRMRGVYASAKSNMALIHEKMSSALLVPYADPDNPGRFSIPVRDKVVRILVDRQTKPVRYSIWVVEAS